MRKYSFVFALFLLFSPSWAADYASLASPKIGCAIQLEKHAKNLVHNRINELYKESLKDVEKLPAIISQFEERLNEIDSLDERYHCLQDLKKSKLSEDILNQKSEIENQKAALNYFPEEITRLTHRQLLLYTDGDTELMDPSLGIPLYCGLTESEAIIAGTILCLPCAVASFPILLSYIIGSTCYEDCKMNSRISQLTKDESEFLPQLIFNEANDYIKTDAFKTRHSAAQNFINEKFSKFENALTQLHKRLGNHSDDNGTCGK